MNATPARKAASRLRKIYGGDAITLETVERVINEEFASEKTIAKLTEALRNIKFHALHDTGPDEKSAEINRSCLRQVREIAAEALRIIESN